MYPNPIEIDTNIRMKYPASERRRPSRSINAGRITHPSIVPADSTIVPYEASREASGAEICCRSAISRTAVGTYTEPAHKPTIETSRNIEFIAVRRANGVEKIRASALLIGGCRFEALRSIHTVDSRTPYRMKLTSSAGVPPTANIQRQPYRVPTT